ncbi:mechanosensitive ion channel family protein [Phaeobacter sp. A36a-5a]|uniref:mechanosensitive ion channel family protein n=1 Tax=Phaeobacter bryozoorum TaxID=1086632 RepID=UPI0035A74511
MTAEISATLMDQLTGWLEGAIDALPRLAVAIIVLVLTAALVWAAKTIIRRISSQLKLRRNLCDVLQLLASVLLWLIGSLIAVTVVFPTITPGKALTTLGLGSVAIGFAFKDTFENFLAGILLLLREPFQIGDFIECEGAEGKIEAITVRDTRIRQTDGQLVVVPNAQLFHNAVTVRTNRELRRATLICGVAYGEDVDTARDVISKAVRGVDMVRNDVRDFRSLPRALARPPSTSKLPGGPGPNRWISAPAGIRLSVP